MGLARVPTLALLSEHVLHEAVLEGEKINKHEGRK
jgi:hypothetical protein